MEKLIVCLIAAFWWGLFYLFFTKDRSRYRNCYLLIVALLHSILVLLMLSGSYMFDVFMALIITFLVAILIVPFFLIQNGIVMIRREGKSLANLLSLFFGILIGIGSACASNKQRISEGLRAMGISRPRAESALRFTVPP